MCGIAGYWTDQGEVSSDLAALMALQVRHRGPDDSGAWCDRDAGIALGHQRLSIVDLGESGRQPMISACDRYVLVYNGEVYNHGDLKKELSAASDVPSWRGRSDTEVLLRAISRWGVKQTLERVNGMFAFAVWDRQQRLLYLARDRFGEKPLYYGWCGRTFLFGSELKALHAHPQWRGNIDQQALSLYLRYNNVPAPHSIYAEIKKMSPGTLAEIRPELGPNHKPIQHRYWSAADGSRNGEKGRFSGSLTQAKNVLETLLMDAVRIRMSADVPVGAFLSGGVDSSLIAALMQAQSSSSVSTFSIGFEENQFDESVFSQQAAACLGTDHTELRITSQDCLETVPKLPAMYDEPFADSSQIVTYLASRLARQKVAVALSGDGGDEFFGGYNHYSRYQKYWRNMTPIPFVVRHMLAASLYSLSRHSWDRLNHAASRCLPSSLEKRVNGNRIYNLAGILKSSSVEDMMLFLQSNWQQGEVQLNYASAISNTLDDEHAYLPSDHLERMMYIDSNQYLPNDILTKVDRASMAVSLETRIPLLDHRICEFAWTLPPDMKISGNRGKIILRELLGNFMPTELIERPKKGFSVPLGPWLRGPLRDWAEALLEEKKLREECHFDELVVREKWNAHLRGDHDWSQQLWIVLMFQAWLDNVRSQSTARSVCLQ